MVSAYLVNPTNDKRIALPTDNLVPAADAETILFGRLNAVHPPQGLKSAGNDKTGFIVE
jgi:Flp pilus assembly secretin CpaC